MIPGEELLFVALGGSGEIGMNVNLYGCRGQWIMVDLGLTFADPTYPGIELILPDLEFIEDQQERLAGIVLTHGHEDHIGALPYLAEELKSPLYATLSPPGSSPGSLRRRDSPARSSSTSSSAEEALSSARSESASSRCHTRSPKGMACSSKPRSATYSTPATGRSTRRR